MADYNVYIHAIGTGNVNAGNPTLPWSVRDGGEGVTPTSSQTGMNIGGAAMNFTRAIGYAQNPDSIVGSAVSGIAKASPYVLAAFAVVKLGVAITDNALDFAVLESGYRAPQIQWQNLKNSVNNMFHPFSSALNSYKTNRQWAIENQKHQANRDLLGDSVINSYTNRGV